MDRQAFKQRMQNLKSYRENNPGKGYWDWKVEAFADGGQTGDPEKERFYQATGRSSSGRPLEEGLKPVFCSQWFKKCKSCCQVHSYCKQN